MTSMQHVLDTFSNLAQGVIHQMGEHQPHDLVLVYKNPTDDNLSNRVGDDYATAVVIITDDEVSRTINLEVDFVGADVTVIVASTIEQAVTIKFADGSSKAVTASANTPLFLRLNDQFGIPVTDGSGFFI